MNERPTPELEQLFCAACDESLTEDELAALEAALIDNAQLQDEYLAFCHLHAELRQRGQAARAVQPMLSEVQREAKALVVRPPNQPWVKVYGFFAQRTPFSMTVAALVMGIIITAMVFMVSPAFRAITHTEDESSTSPYRIVAEVSGLHQAQWTDPNASAHRGAYLVPGRPLQLEQGTIEITYRDGATVLLEGPCDYVVEDLGRGTLNRGRLLARVPKSAVGFHIATPSVAITDLGTEFGVEVDEQGESEVAVLAGKVECASARNEGSSPSRMLLTQGQSATVNRRGAITKHRSANSPLLAELQQRRAAMQQRRDFRRIAGVSIHDVSSELLKPFDRSAVHLVNGSGLSGGKHAAVPDGSMWETRGTLEEPHDPLPAYVTFDLGGPFELTGMHVWNYNEATHGLHSVGAREVEIHVSPTDNLADLVPIATPKGNFTFPQADGTPSYAGFDVAFADAVNAELLTQVRLVRFMILSNHGGANDLTGLSEVQFHGRPRNPEEPLTP